jgi:hypothetical protein
MAGAAAQYEEDDGPGALLHPIKQTGATLLPRRRRQNGRQV